MRGEMQLISSNVDWWVSTDSRERFSCKFGSSGGESAFYNANTDLYVLVSFTEGDFSSELDIEAMMRRRVKLQPKTRACDHHHGRKRAEPGSDGGSRE